MRQAILVGFVLVSGCFVMSHPAVAALDHSPEVPYSGYAEDSEGNPLSGAHNIVLRFFDGDSEKPHYMETHSKIVCQGGRFELLLGAGVRGPESQVPALTALTDSFEAIDIEAAIDGTVQMPRISMVPLAGGAPRDLRFLGANSSRPNDPSTDKARGGRGFALQAVTLRPKTTVTVADPPNTKRINPFLVATVFYGTSESIRSLPPYSPTDEPTPNFFESERESPPEGARVDGSEIEQGQRTSRIDDPLALESHLHTVGEPQTPGLLIDFDGLPSTIMGPPDSEGAVGPNHYFQAVNIAIRIYDKQGVPLTEPIATNELYADSGSYCESDIYADPIIVYDEAADRWILTHLAFHSSIGLATCIAVSTNGDPTGEYFLYEVQTVGIPDYPKIGVWPDPVHNAYFMSTNPGPLGTFDVYALDRESLLAGTAPRPARMFSGNPNFMMPADLDGGRAAPAGSPGIFYTFRDGGEDYFIPGTPVDTLDLYEFVVDWDNPAQSSLTHVHSFTPPEFAEFNWTVCDRTVRGECLAQPGTTQQIDSLSWLPMQRLQYRNLGRYETLVGVWTVNAVAEGKHAALRWFELRRSNGSDWMIAYQGTFAPDSSHRWMGSVALDGSGNMAMGYNVVEADAGIYPSLRYTVRPVNSAHFVEEATQIDGSGFVDGLAAWGDYSSMEVDPTDNCTFWFTGEYVETSGPSTWSTRISAFRIPGCTGYLSPIPGEDDVITETEN